MDSFDQEIRRLQRGMKASHLTGFMNQFEPYHRRVNWTGSSKGHCLSELVRWVTTGFEYGRLAGGTSTPEQISRRWDRVKQELTAYRKEREAQDERQARDKQAMEERFRRAEAEAVAREQRTASRVLRALTGTRLEPVLGEIRYGAHECGLPHELLIRLAEGYQDNKEAPDDEQSS